MRRAVKITAWVLGSAALLAVLLVAAVLVVGNTAPGRAMIERVTYRLTGGYVKLSGLGGSFPTQLTLDRLELIDRGGVWLSADHIALRWSPWALLERRISAQSLQVARLDMERAPLSEASKDNGPVTLPHIDIARFSIDVVQLGAALAGRAATLSLQGSGRMISLEDASADVEAHRIDSAGNGEYTLHLRFDPKHMDGTLELHEPASGPLENILQVPGLGALSANLRINGPRNAERIDLALSAGDLTAKVQGSLDLHNGSAQLDYSLEAPQVSPRPDLRWQRIALNGHWHGSFAEPTADGHLEVDQLQLPGSVQIAALRADLTASGGTLGAAGAVNGLRMPGAGGSLLGKDPLKIEASMRLNEATRPLVIEATHRLFSLKAQAVTAGEQRVAFDLRLPSVTPFAALAGQDVRGDATIKGQIERRGSGAALTVDANAGITGGAAAWIGLVENRLALQFSAALDDHAVTVDRLRLSGPAWTLSASASAARPDPEAGAANSTQAPAGIDAYVKDVKARWDLSVSDLSIIAPQLTGTLQASGGLAGTPRSLAGDANLKSVLSIRGSPPGTVTAELQARGLPSSPSASVQLKGMVDGSPLDLAASLARGNRNGLRATVQRGEWKSAHLEGEWAMESSIADSRGQIRLKVGQLGDFDRLLGTNIQGKLEASADFTPHNGDTHAKFELDGQDLLVGQFAGALHLTGEGSTSSVAAHLDAKTPDLKGYPAGLTADASVNLDTHEVRVLHAAANYRGEQFKLLLPAKASYEHGFSIDEFKLGVEDAVLDVRGELSPTLDLRASLTRVDPKLINAFMPDLVLQGTIEGNARLRGALAAPTGRISIAARGFRFASDEALGLPALDLNAGAELSGDTAAIEVRLNAGSSSLLSVQGSAPLNADGVFDLKIAGKMDVGVVNPLLEARGLHAGGELAVDATIAGKQADPQIRGAITLAKGNVRDYAHGFSLNNITAEISGSEGTLQIKSFKASAASGSVGMTGSIGVLQPGIPVDIKITAANAQPIASTILTANLNADIHVSGTARERLAVAGTIHVNRAVIGIPDSLPPDIAVLDVRRRGKPVPVAGKRLEIDLDIAIKAPREVLVQGRGLDAELGGDDLHIGGTTETPLVSGGLTLQRGTFTIGSNRLNFDTSSRVSFDGTGLRKSIDPTLDFTATTTVQGATATLHISGYADAPKFELSSTTGQSQDEIMALLLFGQPASQLTALQAAQAAAALATLSGIGGGGSNPLTKLQHSLGLDRLSVGAGTTTTATGATENSGAAIQAGRYISRRVYIEGKQSTTGQSQVEVDVDLTKSLKLQTRLGNGTAIQGTTPDNDPGSSIGLTYQFEY
jgi:translocation and assembly module TamB